MCSLGELVLEPESPTESVHEVNPIGRDDEQEIPKWNLGSESLNSADHAVPTVISSEQNRSGQSTARNSKSRAEHRPSRLRKKDRKTNETDARTVAKSPWDAPTFEKTTHRRERARKAGAVPTVVESKSTRTPTESPWNAGATFKKTSHHGERARDNVVPSTKSLCNATTFEKTTHRRGHASNLVVPSVIESASSTTAKPIWDAATFEKTTHRRGRARNSGVQNPSAGNGIPTHNGSSDAAPNPSHEISQERYRLVESVVESVVDESSQSIQGLGSLVPENYENKELPSTGNELVAATAVIEDDDEESQERVLAHAFEHDPKSTPAFYRAPRFGLYCTLGTVLFVVVLAVSIVYAKKERNDVVILSPAPTTAPSLSPTSMRDMVIREYLAGLVNDKVFNPDTPHYTAVDWIVNKDPMQLEIVDPNLLQRFLMALLYFQSTDNGNKQWTSCNPPSKGEENNCDFVAFNMPQINATRWLTGEDECSWAGLFCDDEHSVFAIALDGQNMTGTLPSELVALPLRIISFLNNQITGTIPAQYASFPKLLSLELNGNKLTGAIPVEFFEQDSLLLMNFNVGGNHLTGTLDPRIGSAMPNLEGLHIFNNDFHGTFPSEIGNLVSLASINAYGNQFSGPIPTELGRLSKLQEFLLHENRFSGTIPSELGLLSNLWSLLIGDNLLTGNIPEELFNLTTLDSLEMNNMVLTGTLSTRVGQLTRLTALNLQGNQLTGPIPTEIQNMSNLTDVYINFNQFTGSVPDEICSLGIDTFQADCLPADNPPNPCLCCTACCDRDRAICLTNSE